MDLNRIILIGRLCTDPELSYTQSGIAVSKTRIAVNRPQSSQSRDSGEEKQVDFINIVAWRGTAEFCANYLTKGRLIAVEGRLQIREYVDNEGRKQRQTEVVADNIKSLDRPKEEGTATDVYNPPVARQPRSATRQADNIDDLNDPFEGMG